MTTLTSDAFGRADGALAGSSCDAAAGGANLTWVNNAGTWAISSNKARDTAGGAADIIHVDLDEFGDGELDVYVGVTLSTVLTDSFAETGVIARMVDANNYYSAVYATDSGSIVLLSTVAASVSLLGSSAVIPVDGDILGIRCTGTTIELLLNGTVLDTATDSSLTTGLLAGLWGSGFASNGFLDDFVVTNGDIPGQTDLPALETNIELVLPEATIPFLRPDILHILAYFPLAILDTETPPLPIVDPNLIVGAKLPYVTYAYPGGGNIDMKIQCDVGEFFDILVSCFRTTSVPGFPNVGETITDVTFDVSAAGNLVGSYPCTITDEPNGLVTVDLFNQSPSLAPGIYLARLTCLTDADPDIIASVPILPIIVEIREV